MSNTSGTGEVGTLTSDGVAICLSKPTKRRGRPSYLTGNCLKAAHCSNHSLLLLSVVIFPMKLSMASKRMFPQKTKGLLDWRNPCHPMWPGFLNSFAGFECNITINEHGGSRGNWIKHLAIFFPHQESPRIHIEITYGEIAFEIDPRGGPITLCDTYLVNGL